VVTTVKILGKAGQSSLRQRDDRTVAIAAFCRLLFSGSRFVSLAARDELRAAIVIRTSRNSYTSGGCVHWLVPGDGGLTFFFIAGELHYRYDLCIVNAALLRR